MAEYSSTREGFQRAMEWALTGPPDETAAYVNATSLPTFYHIVNGERTEIDVDIKRTAEWRGKVANYKPSVEEFLRDGNQLAARMTGTIDVEGAPATCESFMFGKVDKEAGKLEYLVERSVWGHVGQEPTRSVS